MNIEAGSDLSDMHNPQKIEIAKEELHISKRTETETLVFRKEVMSEQVEIPVELLRQDIDVVRIPKDEELTQVPQMREEGNVTIIPIFEERAVVVKKLFLKEEIHITKKQSLIKETVVDTVRHEVFTKSENNH